MEYQQKKNLKNAASMLLALMGALMLAGCGGSSSTATSTPTSTGTTAAAVAAAAASAPPAKISVVTAK